MATKNNRGRRSIYDTVILPNLDKIKQWTKNGATEKQICETLGISVSAYNSHKDKEEFANAIKKGRTELVLDLRGELVRIALPHTQTTRKTYVKQGEDGKDIMYSEVTDKECDGEIAAIHLLLKNLDREDWKDNWDNVKFKEREMQLKEKLADLSLWK